MSEYDCTKNTYLEQELRLFLPSRSLGKRLSFVYGNTNKIKVIRKKAIAPTAILIKIVFMNQS
jgi:hypothetical protein